MAKPKYKPCKVTGGRFVEPCVTLNSVIGKAVEHRHLTNMKTGKPSRSFVILKSGEHREKGIILNCCPFCGTRIDAPVASDESEAA